MAVQESSLNQFGLLIAFVIPGFVVVWGAGHFLPVLQTWLLLPPNQQPSVGGFLYVTVASIGAGLLASTVRWLVIDTFHHRTGLRSPKWDFSRFHEIGPGYDRLNELHYRFYQFYGNTAVAIAFAYLAHRSTVGWLRHSFGWSDLGVLIVLAVLFAGSRDTLRKYYVRVEQLMGIERTVDPVLHNRDNSGNQIDQVDAECYCQFFDIDE